MVGGYAWPVECFEYRKSDLRQLFRTPNKHSGNIYVPIFLFTPGAAGSTSLHPHRIARSDRDYCHPGSTAPAGAFESKSARANDTMPLAASPMLHSNESLFAGCGRAFFLGRPALAGSRN